jgi:potassium-transporting ATPase KdpC subunit
MKTLKSALMIFALFSVALGLIYPLVMTGIAQLVFPQQANGSVLIKDGKLVGSELIGQRFTQAVYFHGRPSAVNYDGGGSGASNYGPTEPKLQEQIAQRLTAIRESNALERNQAVPVDLVTASASGLDPHISLESAMLQVPRIAQARHMDELAIRALVGAHTEKPLLSVPYVNVLKLNLALDNYRSEH